MVSSRPARRSAGDQPLVVHRQLNRHRGQVVESARRGREDSVDTGALGKVYEDGDVIIQQGEVGNCMYVIQEGEVGVFMEQGEGRAGDSRRAAEPGDDALGEVRLARAQIADQRERGSRF